MTNKVLLIRIKIKKRVNTIKILSIKKKNVTIYSKEILKILREFNE